MVANRSAFVIFFSLVIHVMPVLVFAKNSKYILEGKVRNPSQGMAYLRCMSDPNKATDSANIKNGSFTFQGIVKEPLIVRLYLAKVGMRYGLDNIPSIQLYLEPGNIHLTSLDSLAHANIIGTPRNVVNSRLNTVVCPIMERIGKLMGECYAAAIAQPRNTELITRINQDLTAAESERHKVVKKFIQENLQSSVSLDALKEYGSMDFNLSERELLFNSLVAKVQNSKAGQQYANQIARIKATAVGAVAPDFDQPDSTGKLVHLRDFHGKYLLLEFWASWCGPCRRENPSLVLVYNQYRERGFTILGVSLDDTTGRRSWLKAASMDNLSWVQVSDLKSWDNSAARLYVIESIPQNFLIGPDGRIIAKNLSAEELSKILNNLLLKN